MDVTAIILAGGKSSRFGRDKSLLQLNRKLIVQHLVENCSAFAEEILIVSNQTSKFGFPGIRELSDSYPNMGPLGGIHAGLQEASYSTIFVTACDMPFFQQKLAKNMLTQIGSYQAVLPYYANRFEPLFSALDRDAALPVVESMLQQNQRKLLRLFDLLHTYHWQCTEQEQRMFYNINYPEDYTRLLGKVASRKGAYHAGWISI